MEYMIPNISYGIAKIISYCITNFSVFRLRSARGIISEHHEHRQIAVPTPRPTHVILRTTAPPAFLSTSGIRPIRERNIERPDIRSCAETFNLAILKCSPSLHQVIYVLQVRCITISRCSSPRRRGLQVVQLPIPVLYPHIIQHLRL